MTWSSYGFGKRSVTHMPRIPDTHLKAVVFIYSSSSAAYQGTGPGATGFIITAPPADGVQDRFRVPYVVTNRHVAEKGELWVRCTTAWAPEEWPDDTYVVHLTKDKWFFPEGNDDLAVAPIERPYNGFAYEFPLDWIAVTRTVRDAFKVGAGDDVFMCGRYVAQSGRVTNNPFSRFGNISLMPDPDEPVRDGENNDVEAYLVEMRSQGGFSGSPMFVHFPANGFRGTVGEYPIEDNTDRWGLLGVYTGHFSEYLPLVEREAGGRYVTAASHYRSVGGREVAIVCPTWKLVELLEREDVRTDRREREQRMITHETRS